MDQMTPAQRVLELQCQYSHAKDLVDDWGETPPTPLEEIAEQYAVALRELMGVVPSNPQA